jgi:hypothetical protein
MSQDLRDKLESVVKSNGTSLNKEIVGRLERSFDPDPALLLADSIRPALERLSEQDRGRLVQSITDTFAILAKKPGRK